MRALACLFPAALSACNIMPLPTAPDLASEPLPLPAPVEDACGASDLQALIGQSASVLTTMKFASALRVIESDMAVTMDYSANRLNIWLNSSDRIERVTCG